MLESLNSANHSVALDSGAESCFRSIFLISEEDDSRVWERTLLLFGILAVTSTSDLPSDELNCSTRNYTESCHKKDNMFYNIDIVFYRNQEKDCNNYSLFRNIKDIISRSTSKGYVGRSV